MICGCWVPNRRNSIIDWDERPVFAWPIRYSVHSKANQRKQSTLLHAEVSATGKYHRKVYFPTREYSLCQKSVPTGNATPRIGNSKQLLVRNKRTGNVKRAMKHILPGKCQNALALSIGCGYMLRLSDAIPRGHTSKPCVPLAMPNSIGNAEKRKLVSA
jgi:hypothetical protein